MNKQEFLEKLRMSLSGRLPGSLVAENVNYYEEYINTEVRKGKSEEEVLEELGDPRLIARTITETASKAGRGYGSAEAAGTEAQGYGQVPELERSWLAKLPGWIWLLVFALVVIVLICVIFKILKFLAPILIVVGLALFIIRKLYGDF